MTEQNSSDPDSIAYKPPVPPREDLVDTAAKFLSSPNVKDSPRDLKIDFLKKKGLSDAEIKLAFEKSDYYLQSIALKQNPHVLPYPPLQKQLEPTSSWVIHPRLLTIRDIANTIMLIAGIFYGIYWVYKKYVWNFLFGDLGRKKRTSDERLSDIEANLGAITQCMDSLRESIDSKSLLVREISNVKSEVSSIKKMLLSRKQFPSAGAAPLSIPSWQIASANAVDEKEEEGAATNGSDSSLEMIKE